MNIVNIKNIPEEGVSHNPEIKKRILIRDQEIPGLKMFGQAVFKPGQSVRTHTHDSMFEVFYILSGKAMFTVNGETLEVGEGDCVTIAPGDEHSQSNPFDSDATWSYFGIATE